MNQRDRSVSEESPLVDDAIEQLRLRALPLETPGDLDPLLEHIGDARFVLLGEASHGTSEYYTWRAKLSRRLIAEKGFDFIAVEGDWPDCYQINRYVKGDAEVGEDARDVLEHFRRWPTWMWANEEMIPLIEWLHDYNADQRAEKKVGFFGLDVYSLWDSLYAIMTYLHKHMPEALPAAWRAFRCFEPYGEDGQEYARATAFVPKSCEKEVLALLTELRRMKPVEAAADERERHFQAEQNGLVLKNAEAYYRAMMYGGPSSWNIRDQHMAETLQRLMKYHGSGARAIVWEHNTHIGDARFTDMKDDGSVNVGQLIREQNEKDGVVLVGFGTYRGKVVAARRWGAAWERLVVPPGARDSWDEILHRTGAENKLLVFDGTEPKSLLHSRRQRAIGVVYRPEFEHLGNYVPTVLPRRYDALLYIDETRALQPLPTPLQEDEEVPETYPTGM